MQKKFLFVINPVSGGVDKAPILKDIDRWATKAGHQYSVFNTTGEDDLLQIKEVLRKSEADVTVSVGGDGTALLVAEAVMHTDIALGILPAGSANGLATHFSLPKTTDKALNVFNEPAEVRCDMLCFNENRHALHISDLGLNAKLVEHFDQSDARGFMSYADGVLETVKDMEDFEVHIEADGNIHEARLIMLAIANANRYGTGALLNKEGKIDDGRFELCLLKKFDFGNLALHFFDFIDEHAEYMEVISCKKATIKLNKPVAFQIDGELQAETKELKVEIQPGCIKMLIPGKEKSFLERLLS